MAMINRITGVDTASTYNNNKVNPDYTTEFSSYLGETESLDKIFDQAADKYNVPVELLKAVGKAESDFDTNAVSRCGAQGIMQLMPSTAKSLGVTNSFDPEQNIMAGAKYLSGLLEKYNGDTKLALAAYNAGSGNVAKYGGIPPFKETQNYVKKIMGFMNDAGVDQEDTAAASRNSSDTIENVLHVASVKMPTTIQNNLSYLITNSTNNSMTDLNSLFSYDDYMKFLDMYLNDNEEDNTEKENKNYITNEINYNTPVLNLLTDQ